MAEPRKRAGQKTTTLNVFPSTQALVSKLAKHRDKTIPDLFEDRDIQTFFKHLLLAEMEKEKLRLKD